jgi:hypothetical protein
VVSYPQSPHKIYRPDLLGQANEADSFHKSLALIGITKLKRITIYAPSSAQTQTNFKPSSAQKTQQKALIGSNKTTKYIGLTNSPCIFTSAFFIYVMPVLAAVA